MRFSSRKARVTRSFLEHNEYVRLLEWGADWGESSLVTPRKRERRLWARQSLTVWMLWGAERGFGRI